MKRFFLKEYGSWSVMLLSFLTGVLVSKNFTLSSLLSILSLSLFINSKQSLTMWLRSAKVSESPKPDKKAFYILIIQLIMGTFFLFLAYYSNIFSLMPFTLIPLLYIASLYIFGEHAIVSELLGFATLTLASLIGRFSVTGLIDLPLYIATTLFFMAGVLKVRIQLRKKLVNRIAMIIYLFLAIIVCHKLNISLLILLPLIENLIFALTLYRVRLAVTGWIEVMKSILFVILSMSFYQ